MLNVGEEALAGLLAVVANVDAGFKLVPDDLIGAVLNLHCQRYLVYLFPAAQSH
jgi:ABC-type siderophore export system fused ATPase/permease subunit